MWCLGEFALLEAQAPEAVATASGADSLKADAQGVPVAAARRAPPRNPQRNARRTPTGGPHRTAPVPARTRRARGRHAGAIWRAHEHGTRSSEQSRSENTDRGRAGAGYGAALARYRARLKPTRCRNPQNHGTSSDPPDENRGGGPRRREPSFSETDADSVRASGDPPRHTVLEPLPWQCPSTQA